jgi:quercetin dioxygenase-like cupin family protein
MVKYFYAADEASRHTIFPGVQIGTVAGDRLMLSVVEFAPRSVVEPHSHPHEQMGLLLEGELTFIVGDEKRTLRAGEMWRIPGGVVHSVFAGDEPARALDVFHPVRDDYR